MNLMLTAQRKMSLDYFDPQPLMTKMMKMTAVYFADANVGKGRPRFCFGV